MARVTRELQRVSLSLRMVPIRGVFQKMARVVRDLAARQSKEVQLVTEGEETELDRNMVEELADPLLHMIRNALDHGIEAAAARAAQGKPRAGVLHLRARHQAGGILVELQDDGQGLDKERILAKAVEKGLAAPGAKLSDEEIFHFIFAAGFSTAREVTDLSGRGVGLDVVRRNIERLRGRVEVSSAPGQGTLFKLVLPLTLAIIDGLIVTVGGQRYIIPTLLVRESFRPRREMISTLQGRGELVNLRGRLIPMLRLGEQFGVKPAASGPADGIIVVVQTGASLKCLLVDGLLHRQEVVIKNVGEIIRQRNASIAGAAILGDGRVGLIIDVNSLGSLPVAPGAHAANN
jgi:two-component system chemotaxis sensor kinase CheA